MWKRFVFLANRTLWTLTRLNWFYRILFFVCSSSFHYFFVDNFSYVQLCGNFSNHSYPTLTLVVCNVLLYKYDVVIKYSSIRKFLWSFYLVPFMNANTMALKWKNYNLRDILRGYVLINTICSRNNNSYTSTCMPHNRHLRYLDRVNMIDLSFCSFILNSKYTENVLEALHFCHKMNR